MFIFLVIESIPINALDKPLREKGNWDDEEEETVDKDKASEEEPKHQKGKHKATTFEGVFKAPKSRKTTFSNPPSPTVSEKTPKKPKKRKTKVNTFIIFSIGQIFFHNYITNLAILSFARPLPKNHPTTPLLDQRRIR